MAASPSDLEVLRSPDSLWLLILEGGPISIAVQVANIVVLVLLGYCFIRGLGSQSGFRAPRWLMHAPIIPLILSAGLSLAYLSQMPTADALIRALTSASGVPNPGADGWFEWAMFITSPVHIAELVRLNLFSGLIFGLLSLVTCSLIKRVDVCRSRHSKELAESGETTTV